MAYENEFELFTGDKDHREPAMPHVAFSTESMDFAYPFILKAIDQLQKSALCRTLITQKVALVSMS